MNPTGNAALATGGSGDVLSGLLGALLVSIDDSADASIVAAYVHGLVADQWSAETGGDRGLLAREIADGLPRAIGSLVGRAEHLPRGAGDGGRGVTR